MNERTDIYSTRLMLRRYRNVYINTRRESNVVRNIYAFERESRDIPPIT